MITYLRKDITESRDAIASKNNIDISSDSVSSPGFIDNAAITEGDHLTQGALESQGEAPDMHEHELVDEEPH